MTNTTPDHLGQINNAGDEKATFQKIVAAEIIAAYDEANVSDQLHFTRTIDHGKSAAFPMTGKVGAGYHVKGTPLLGSQTLAKNEIVINVDDLLVSDVMIADIDEAMAHIDYRGEYTRQVGAALARAKDTRIFQTACLAARSAGIVTGMPGGSVMTNAAALTDGDVLASMISQSAVALDEKDVPMQDRYGIFRPAQTHLLATTPNVIHKDLGGEGSVATGYVGSYDNVKIMKSNNVPRTVIGAVAGDENVYGGDFTNTVGLVMNRNAVGTVKMMDLVVQMTNGDHNIVYQGTLLVGKYLQGHGILNAANAVEITTA